MIQVVHCHCVEDVAGPWLGQHTQDWAHSVGKYIGYI